MNTLKVAKATFEFERCNLFNTMNSKVNAYGTVANHEAQDIERQGDGSVVL